MRLSISQSLSVFFFSDIPPSVPYLAAENNPKANLNPKYSGGRMFCEGSRKQIRFDRQQTEISL